MSKAVAILDVMWDWGSMTSSSGYTEIAPTYYRINPNNHTGSRLYWFLGGRGKVVDDLLVTNACKELVCSAKERGTPDKKWLRENLAELWPFDLLLVCGKVAQATYEQKSALHPCRIIEMPHPAARTWNTASLVKCQQFIQSGTQSLSLRFVKMETGSYRLIAEKLIPF